MLPASLERLANQFNVESKGIFPYEFVKSNNLNYEGAVPAYKYFKNITDAQYREYCAKYTYVPWNLKKESEIYCNNDCKVLHNILSIFFKENFGVTRVNGSKYVSLSALALANFRAFFMAGDVKIANLRGEVYKFIKQGYFGGAVDVFKPSGQKIYCYDVNSLYPYVMRFFKMPVGLPTLLSGSSSLIETIVKDSNKFSFVEVDVFCPENLKVPLLLHKINNKTVAPTGKWKGVYTSTEINRAIQLGYKFKYKKCVHFECKYIFTDYVDFYFNLKKK
uniref:hypothetical protein n=1 Tax=Lentinus flexipes TaxID=3163629 RepID=UPI002264B710|nr:hypothetical protein OSR58_mgp14 [Ganoderma flexipes]UYX56947.1 hypothetical protein [Ganoderma flexipes]